MERFEKFKNLNNPFAVKSPEGLSAEDAHSLFVPVFTDFPQLLTPGHTFLHGPRGSGKSMMFRYLRPDCQLIEHEGCKLKDLPFFAIWVRVKDANLAIEDLKLLDNKHGSSFLNEHFMVMYLSEIALNTVQENISHSNFSLKEVKNFTKDIFMNSLECCGWEVEHIRALKTVSDYFKYMIRVCHKIHANTWNYIKNLSNGNSSYDGLLCGYLDFLYPVLCGLKDLTGMPKGPIFLLIDDADKLSLTQTKILNSWVYTRTQANVSIKISTQMQYKTYITTNGSMIQTPHDFSETNISTVYTSSAKDNYPDRIKEIVKKRFALFDIKVKPEDYFPPDEAQEKEIEKIYKSYQENWDKQGRGYRPEDDAYRYARPDYIKMLGGCKKAKSTYSYSGFKQLVDISSGIIRYFLDPASKMYSKMQSTNPNGFSFISPRIQDEIIKEYSDDFLIVERERLEREQGFSSRESGLVDKLFNLIEVLGGTFSEIIMSVRSERRVFSIAFYKKPSRELQEILDMGLALGYFHASTIGNKEGTGRIRLYILSRLLAPAFRLDPTGFSGYLFVSEEQIWEAIHHPSKILRRIREEGTDKIFGKTEQQTLFE